MVSVGHKQIPEPYRAATGLTPEVLTVLQRRGNATIGSINPDGTVHMAPVWFLFDKSGVVYFECSSATRKARNIAARSKASVLVKGRDSNGSGLIVLGQGDGRIVTGDPMRPIAARIRRKYLTTAGLGPVSDYLDRIDDAVAELTPTSWVSWSSRAINDSIQALAEYRDGDWDKWFLPDID